MLGELKKIDELELKSYKKTPVYLHKDHRFAVPLIHNAQSQGLLPRPCTLVVFDRHHDLADLSDELKLEMKEMRRYGIDDAKLLELVKDKMRGDDSDWIKALLELGFVDNVVIFGIREDISEDNPFTYHDSSGDSHKIYHLYSFPGGLLGYQGMLSDHARKYELKDFWEILGWTDETNPYSFKKGLPRIALNFDLDAFVAVYDEFAFPWPEEVYKRRFYQVSTYFTDMGWNGKKITHGLCKKAGVITIAKEPDYCGGQEKMKTVLEDFNRYIFDNKII